MGAHRRVPGGVPLAPLTACMTELGQVDAGVLNVVYLDAGPPAGKFAGAYSHRTIEGGVGHNLPQEAPAAFAEAVLIARGAG